MEDFVFESSDIKDTRRLAHALARVLKGGDIVFLSGPIGAGKTVIVSACAEALGCRKKPVSASFSLMKKYTGGKNILYHIDLFRLKEDEMFNLGFEPMLEDETSVIFAEWPAPAQNFFPKDRLEITLDLAGGTKRKITLSAGQERGLKLLKDLKKIIYAKEKTAK
jgi:tRNA threonylcarbamoyladenosine biosynthesis protein TsaE